VKRHATRRTGWWIPGALLLFAGVIGAGPVLACSCLSPEPDEFVAEIGILFRGALVSERQLPPSSDCGDQNCMLEGLFRVEESLKGTLGQTVRLTYYAPDFMCSPSFQVGQTVVVAGYGDAERGYETDDCTQFETTYDAEPSDAEAYPVLAAAARQRAWLATLAGAAEKDPGNPVPLIAQARFLAATSGTLEAIGLLDRALAADPLQRDAVLLKAEILSARKHDHQALALIEPYLSARPDDVEAKRQQVLSLIRIGRIADVAKDWRDFSTLEAGDLDFSKRDLAGASFRGGRLRDISFAAANLQRANLSGLELWSGGDFSSADLAGADLRKSHISSAKFSAANLSGADLRHASLSGDFTGADLTGAKASHAGFPDNLYAPNSFVSFVRVKARGLVANQSFFANPDFTDADLSGADFRRASLWSPQFIGTDLRRANFAGASLLRSFDGQVAASLARADLTGTLLQGADLTGSKLNDATLDSADLTNAKLSAADLRGASFKDATLTGTDLATALYDDATTWPAGFDPVAAGAIKQQ
jgi:uncharacterized protein YjbI with pentapeptide repeats